MAETLQVQRELPKQAADRLKEMIKEKHLEPGERIPTEAEMVKMFGVGRSTIREAVKILVAENIVEIRRGTGTFVTKRPGLVHDPFGLQFTNQDKLLYNLFETRLIVEPHIAYLAALRATERDINKIAEILDMFSRVPVSNHDEFSRLDIRLHTAIARSTGNDVLYRFLPSICDSIREGQHKTADNRQSQKKANESHANIFAAIRQKDPEAAKLEADKHIRGTAKDAKIYLGGEL